MTVMRSTPGRIAAVAIGVPVLLAGIGQGAFNVTGLLARSSEHHEASYAWHGGTLTMKADNGDITVRRSSSASAVSVSYTEHFGLKKPTVTGRATAGGVELSSKCPKWIFDNYCSVNYVIEVPDGTPLKLETGDGSVSLEGVDGAVTVNSGDGWKRAHRSAGRFRPLRHHQAHGRRQHRHRCRRRSEGFALDAARDGRRQPVGELAAGCQCQLSRLMTTLPSA